MTKYTFKNLMVRLWKIEDKLKARPKNVVKLRIARKKILARLKKK